MTTEQKLIAYAISALLAAVLSIVTYNFYDSSVRVAAYRECVEANKVIADMLSSSILVAAVLSAVRPPSRISECAYFMV